jgi:hypothetical protein
MISSKLRERGEIMSTSVQHRRPGLRTLLSSIQPLDIPSPITKEERAFALFPKLQPELRRQIWGHVAPEPRILYLLPTDKYSSSRSENTTRYHQTTYPAILATSQVSRSEGLRFYTRCIELGFSERNFNAVTYLNLECDRIRSRIHRFEEWTEMLPSL